VLRPYDVNEVFNMGATDHAALRPEADHAAGAPPDHAAGAPPDHAGDGPPGSGQQIR